MALLRNTRPTFTKIKWVTGNVKTLSIHHGYDIQDDNIWKTIIEKMKSCIYVWKSRNLTCGGKTLITKNLLLSLCENEIEMRGIPDKYVNEINGIMWSGKANQISRNVCCLETNEGGRVY